MGVYGQQKGGSMTKALLCFAVAVCLFAATAFASEFTDSLTPGNIELKSAAQLAFGPDGILFIADSHSAIIFAVDTKDMAPAASPSNLEVKGINTKIAALLGLSADDILINDFKVSPYSKAVYFAVSRGRGADAKPVVLRMDGTGKMTEFGLSNVRYASLSLPDAGNWNPKLDRTPNGSVNGNPRIQSITDMNYVNGKVLVAGISNEEFASDLRAIPFPFRTAEKSTGIQIWHSAHGRYETASPVRTFVPYTINKEEYILAAYTCTPLVKIPVNSLKPGAKITGTTIAELGESNRPLEMISYRRDGHDYALMSNNKRGVMKINFDNLGNYKAITPPSAQCEQSREGQGPGLGPSACRGEIEGVPYQTIENLKGVLQIARIDDNNALILSDPAPAYPALKLVPGQATWHAPDLGVSLDLRAIQLP
jgi:hypothetical protein